MNAHDAAMIALVRAIELNAEAMARQLLVDIATSPEFRAALEEEASKYNPDEPWTLTELLDLFLAALGGTI